MKKLFSVILSLCMALTWLFNSVPTAARAEEEAPAAPMELLAAKEISKYIDYSSAVEHGHVARVYAEEDMNTLVYLNQDGTKTAYFFDHDVKYEDADGNIKEKDIGLKTVDGGFGLKQSDITLKLPTDVLDGVEFTHNGNYIKLVPLVDNMQTSIGQLVTQPMDAVVNAADNEVTYGRAFGVGVSLKYTPVINGVKEDIILNSYTGENTWSFLLTTNGMYPFTDEGGVYYFAKTANAASKYSLGRVYAYDSNGGEAYGTMDVTEVKPGAMYIVSLAVDDTFLQGAEYPVTVDPTLTVGDSGIEDTGIYQNASTTNHGTYAQPYIGYYSSYGKSRVLMRFASLRNNSVLSTYMDTVQSATLTLWVTNTPSQAGALKVYRFLNTTWTESGATWANATPNNYESTPIASYTVSSGGYQNINIPVSYINACKANASYINGGVILVFGDETSSSSYIRLASSEFTNTTVRPVLRIKYTTDMSDIYHTEAALLKVGETTQTVKVPIYEDYVTYVSGNTNIATVNSSGVITGVSGGHTYINIVMNFDSPFEEIVTVTRDVYVQDNYPGSTQGEKVYVDSNVLSWERDFTRSPKTTEETTSQTYVFGYDFFSKDTALFLAQVAEDRLFYDYIMSLIELDPDDLYLRILERFQSIAGMTVPLASIISTVQLLEDVLLGTIQYCYLDAFEEMVDQIDDGDYVVVGYHLIDGFYALSYEVLEAPGFIFENPTSEVYYGYWWPNAYGVVFSKFDV